jgi:ribulose-phosphate 3-epimerase
MPAIKIAPALLAADFGRLAEEISSLADAGADLIHIEVMDGRFAPNLTLGPGVIARLRAYCALPVHVQLAVESPETLLHDIIQTGAEWVSFHIETTRQPHRLLNALKEAGCRAGIALNPGTSETELEFVLDQADFAVVMTANPGYPGQTFVSEMLPKINNLRAMLGNRDLAVSGGITELNAGHACEAGANVFMPAEWLFETPSYLEAIEGLRASAESAATS